MVEDLNTRKNSINLIPKVIVFNLVLKITEKNSLIKINCFTLIKRI